MLRIEENSRSAYKANLKIWKQCKRKLKLRIVFLAPQFKIEQFFNGIKFKIGQFSSGAKIWNRKFKNSTKLFLLFCLKFTLNLFLKFKVSSGENKVEVRERGRERRNLSIGECIWNYRVLKSTRKPPF